MQPNANKNIKDSNVYTIGPNIVKVGRTYDWMYRSFSCVEIVFDIHWFLIVPPIQQQMHET